jgi:hypothetical protein
MRRSRWAADPAAQFARRWGRPPRELGTSGGDCGSPDLWELTNGDVAVIGRDMTDAYRARLPVGVGIDEGERLVVVPRATIIAAKADIPDA